MQDLVHFDQIPWAKSWTNGQNRGQINVSGGAYFECMKLSCPNCNSSETLKKILYGMPSDDFDYSKFEVGGYIPSDAKVRCTKCGWQDAD